MMNEWVTHQFLTAEEAQEEAQEFQGRLLSRLNGTSAAAHAQLRGVPRIRDAETARIYKDGPDLRQYRAYKGGDGSYSELTPSSWPCIWYWQLTGGEWDRKGATFKAAKKAFQEQYFSDHASHQSRRNEKKRKEIDEADNKRLDANALLSLQYKNSRLELGIYVSR